MRYAIDLLLTCFAIVLLLLAGVAAAYGIATVADAMLSSYNVRADAFAGLLVIASAALAVIGGAIYLACAHICDTAAHMRFANDCKRRAMRRRLAYLTRRY